MEIYSLRNYIRQPAPVGSQAGLGEHLSRYSKSEGHGFSQCG